jgi:hypothetical protein
MNAQLRGFVTDWPPASRGPERCLSRRGTFATDHWQILTPRSALMHTKNRRRPSRAVIVAARRAHPVNLAD